MNEQSDDKGPRRRGKFARFGRPKRLVYPEEPLDYKNINYLSTLITPVGKIVSRKRTAFSGQNQRKLAQEVKRARFMALLPYIGGRD